MSYEPRKGKQLGTWKLIAFLGKGGNGEVWTAQSNGGDPIAIKILSKTDRSSYQRFSDEIGILRSNGNRPGILPLLDASLPASPNKNSPAWFAMPIATGIKVALGTNPTLEKVVEAVADIAQTLAILAQENIFHRDIKPGNLYKYDEKWVIGDFGLVDFPGKHPVTDNERRLGPLFFIADEMISDPMNANGAPADVYSIAKTLWVLATDQNYPPQGEQRFEEASIGIRTFNSHPRANVLDRLIERATNHTPGNRPKMEEVVMELQAWLNPPQPPAGPNDLSDLASRVTISIEPSRRAEAARRSNIIEMNQLFDSWVPQVMTLKPIFQQAELPNVTGSPTIGYGPTGIDTASLAIGVRSGWIHQRFLGIRSFVIGTFGVFHCECAMYLYEDRQLDIVAAYTLQSEPKTWQLLWSTKRTSTLGSSLQDHLVREVTTDLMNNARFAVEQYVSFLETKNSQG